MLSSITARGKNDRRIIVNVHEHPDMPGITIIDGNDPDKFHHIPLDMCPEIAQAIHTLANSFESHQMLKRQAEQNCLTIENAHISEKGEQK